MSNEPAAITGVGAVTPLGIGADALYEGWVNGESGLQDGRGDCTEFDPSAFLTRKQVRRTERFVQFAMSACKEAIDQAWDGELPYAPDRIACVLGVAFGGTQTMFEQYEAMKEGGSGAISPLTVPVIMPNAPPALLAMAHGFRGETRSIASACASSAQAIGEGLRMLRVGEYDAVIVGGAEACMTEFVMGAFRNAGALSRTGVSRPFDRRRDGFVMAEGAGILILENPELAGDRGAEVLGYVTGYSSSTDGHHLTAPAEDGATCAHAMRAALADAGCEPGDVDWVNAHGTSTTANDKAETNALKVALGDHAYKVPVSAPKSVVGHSIGAAGAVEAVATVKAMGAGRIPPTVGLDEPDEGLDLNYVPNNAVPLEHANGKSMNGERMVAVSNSFAFGGHNAVLVIEA
jgi:3-oxoacyl-[acyl-carrier-protein] synthase II